MSRAFVDANVLLRAILLDHPDQSPRAISLLQRVAYGEIVLRLATAVLFDVAFVLFRRPRLERDAVFPRLETSLEFNGLRIEQRQIPRDAIRPTRQSNDLPIDACLVASMGNEWSTSILSFDRHFDRFPGIKRVEP